MMSNTKPNKTVHDLLARASKNAPPLTSEKIKTILIQAIQSYKKNELSLQALSQLARKLKQESSISSAKNLQQIIDEIKSFSVINEVLNDFLYELTQKEVN